MVITTSGMTAYKYCQISNFIAPYSVKKVKLLLF